MLKRILMILGALVLSVFVSPAHAQERSDPAKPIPPASLPPQIRMTVTKAAEEQPIRITRAAVEGRINGVHAETTMTLTFFNPNDRVMEGELTFPLPPESVVSAYALDINNVLVDGVIVEKEKARVVFEELVRAGIDPGLVESVGGNNFRTRVYPLPAKGTRTVRIRYVSTIAVEPDGSSANWLLPLRFDEKLEKFDLRVDVVSPDAAPRITKGALSGFAFKKWENILSANASFNNIEITEDMNIAVLPPKKATSVAVEKAPADSRFYFAIDDFALLSKRPAKALPPLFTGTILWDASRSRSEQDRAKEFEFLVELYKTPASEIEVIVFRNTPEAPKTFKNVEALIAYLKTVPCDGATSFDALFRTLDPKKHYILFSDGINNFGPIDPRPVGVVNTILNDKNANSGVLKRIAFQSGGVFANLSGMTPDACVKLIADAPPRVAAVTLDGAPYASFASETAGNVFSAAGWIPAGKHQLVFTFSNGVKATYELDTAGSSDGSVLRTNYGQKRIANLTESGAPAQEIAAIGREFSLVTDGTSLIVLDNLDQYVRYKIRPPESLKDMRAEYDRIQDTSKPVEVNSAELEKRCVEAALARWKQRLEWHEKQFNPGAPRIENEKAASVSGGRFVETAGETAIRPQSASVVEPPLPEATSAPATAAEGTPKGDELPDFAVSEDGGGGTLRPSVPAFEDADVVEMQELSVLGAGRDSKLELAKKDAQSVSSAKITAKAWDSAMPYLAELKKDPANAYATYLKESETHGKSAGFYADCADFFFTNGQPEIGVRVLSNLAEIAFENKAFLRALGYKLRFAGELDDAEWVFRRVLPIAGEEPQSYRDLALTLGQMNRYQEAIDLLWKLVTASFDGRFPEIDQIALVEINNLAARALAEGKKVSFDDRFRHNIDADIRIVFSWDADMTDMDLHVTDISGERCYYGYNLTHSGGRLSRDFTRGYGPEEFMIRRALPGEYNASTKYFSNSAQRTLGPVTLYVELFTDYGRPQEKRAVTTFRMTTNKETVELGTLVYENAKQPAFHYQVRQKDSLSSIARKFLGDEKRVSDILKANPSIKDPNKIQVGSILLIPEK